MGFVAGGAVALRREGVEGAAFAGTAAWGGSVHPGDVVFEAAGEPSCAFEPLKQGIERPWIESSACDDLGSVELFLRSDEQVAQEDEHWPGERMRSTAMSLKGVRGLGSIDRDD